MSKPPEPRIDFVSDKRAPFAEIDPITGVVTKICLRLEILSETSEKAMQTACCECAHEIIHCIAPRPPEIPNPCGIDSTSTVLEEGLATLFQAYYHNEIMQIKPPFFEKYKYEALANYKHYASAAVMVQHLLSAKPGAIEKLRLSLPEEAQTCIGLISYDDIKRVFPDLDDTFARNLARPLSDLKSNVMGGNAPNCKLDICIVV